MALGLARVRLFLLDSRVESSEDSVEIRNRNSGVDVNRRMTEQETESGPVRVLCVIQYDAGHI